MGGTVDVLEYETFVSFDRHDTRCQASCSNPLCEEYAKWLVANVSYRESAGGGVW